MGIKVFSYLCITKFIFLFYELSAHSMVHMEIDSHTTPTCPCSNVKWCETIKKNAEKEVFAFSVKNNASYYNLYPWEKLTTIAPFIDNLTDIMCVGHSKGVKVVCAESPPMDQMVNVTNRKAYVDRVMKRIQDNFLDGVNFDFEARIAESNQEQRDAYTATVKDVYDRLKAMSPYYQISIDVSWRPNEYGRYYDYYGLSQVSDFLFCMFYDEPMRKSYAAGPNSGLDYAKKGISLYNNYPGGRIENDKLVLGVPWYGDVYQCAWLNGEECFRPGLTLTGEDHLHAPTPQWDYNKIYTLLMTMPEAYRWNASSSTPYMTYMDDQDRIWQIQYDNAWSVFLKFRLAAQKGLKGIGIFTIDILDYTTTETGVKMRKDWFDTFDVFTGEKEIY